MRQRDHFEAAAHAAITRLRQDITEGVYRPTADRRCVDALLKAGDRYALDALQLRQRQAATTADIDAALEQIRQQAS